MPTMHDAPSQPQQRDAGLGKPPDTHPAWWQKVSIPFPVVIASVVVSAMALLALLLTWQVSNSAQKMIITASDESAHRISMIISERVRRIVDPADASLRMLSFDPISSATTLPARLRRLPVLTGLLAQDPLLSAVYVGYPQGDFLLVRALRNAEVRQRLGAPAQAAFLVQSQSREGGGVMAGRWMFYASDLRQLSSNLKPDYKFDPRTRPWYREAQEKKSQILTHPYVFFTTRELGVTLSQPSDDGRAVLGVDVALHDLGREIEDLRLTKQAEIVVIDGDGQVLAYPDMNRVVRSEAVGGSVRLNSLQSLGVASLLGVQEAGIQPGVSGRFMADGQEWLGLVQPLQGLRGRNLKILMAIPTDELLAEVDNTLRRQFWITVGTIALLLPLGWLAGRWVGRSLHGLVEQAGALTRFDFRARLRPQSPVREVRELGRVMDGMSDTIQKFLDISHHISAESRVDLMLSSVLYRLVLATRCTSGAVYLVSGHGGLKDSQREAQAEGLVRTARYCDNPDDQDRYPETLPMSHFVNYAQPHEAMETPAAPGAPDQGVLQVQLHTRNGQPLGLLSLRYLADKRESEGNFRIFVEKLSGTLSVAIETRDLIEGQKKLFDAVIRLLADAVDAKSAYTGGHCRRVPELAESIMQRMCDTREGTYADVSMTEAELDEFRIGAWLHDCGKVTSPEQVIDKATKLETLYNRIHEVRMRFEVLWRDAEIEYLRQRAAGEDTALLQQRLRVAQEQLRADFAFVARCNIGGETMVDEDIERLRAIGERQWQRHFDNRLGLSWAEEQRYAGLPPDALPVTERLLADRPEHIRPWGTNRPPVEAGNPANRWGFDMLLPAHEANLGELYNLSIRRGTLNSEDRFKINEHIVQTIVMLSSLPFPPHLARVPQIAGTHHEKLDGSGYPRRLKAEELTLADRVMAIADVFEALTAADRPYKPARTVSQALTMMANMVRQNHLDGDVFMFFVESGVWRDYASRFLPAKQLDEVQVQDLQHMLRGVPLTLGAGLESKA